MWTLETRASRLVFPETLPFVAPLAMHNGATIKPQSVQREDNVCKYGLSIMRDGEKEVREREREREREGRERERESRRSRDNVEKAVLSPSPVPHTFASLRCLLGVLALAFFLSHLLLHLPPTLDLQVFLIRVWPLLLSSLLCLVSVAVSVSVCGWLVACCLLLLLQKVVPHYGRHLSFSFSSFFHPKLASLSSSSSS